MTAGGTDSGRDLVVALALRQARVFGINGRIVSFLVLLGSASTWAKAEQPSHYLVEAGRRPDYKLLPAGAALCDALGVKSGEPCDEQVILERSQQSTDRTLWIEKTIGGLDDTPLGRCLQPVAIMTYGEHGIVHACHVADQDDVISPTDIQRLQDVATKLNADRDKTLAKHRWIMNFKDLWRRVGQ